MELARASRRYVAEMVGQLSRYAVTGVASNLILYGMYLGLTGIGGEPKIVMSALYLLGVLQTFLLNRAWTFQYRRSTFPALVRYFVVYALGYIVNLTALMVLVGMAGWDHRYVQATAIPCIAILMFVMQRSWVFRLARQANDAIG
jgi:putative flippase GtrA